MNTFRFIAGHNSFRAHHSETFKRIDSVDDFVLAKRSGRIGLLIGFQNSEHFRAPEDVLYFYGLGQRVSQLTY
jgi:membrane dipeptidase